MNAQKIAATVHYFVHLLKGPATFAFGLYVKQAIVYGVEDVIAGLIAAVAFVLWWRTFAPRVSRHYRHQVEESRAGKNDNSPTYLQDMHNNVLATGWVFAVACAGLAVLAFMHAVPWLFNPQWSAIQMILGH